MQTDSNQKFASYMISKTKQMRFWRSRYGIPVFLFLPQSKTKALTYWNDMCRFAEPQAATLPEMHNHLTP